MRFRANENDKRKSEHKKMHELIETIGGRSGLSNDQVAYALELALEQAVCEYFDLPECLVDIDDKTISPVLEAPLRRKLKKAGLHCSKAIDGELVCPSIFFNALPPKIIEKCRQYFELDLTRIQCFQLYEKWKRKVHHAVEGVIIDSSKGRVEVQLEDTVQGIMLKPEWVPREIPLYRSGAVFLFYVTKVCNDNSAVTVYLSRGSKNFPASLIREKMPWVKIRTIKRIRGKKTWLKSNAWIDPEIIQALQRELKGEAIDIKIN